MSDNEQPPNRRLVEAVYPAGTHLDYSRASSNGMRGNVRDDRDNSLIGQAELFDALDRYADGYHDGYDHRSHDGEFRRYLIDALAREVTLFLGDLVYAAAARGIDAARPRINTWVRQRVDKLRSRSPRGAAAALPEPAQEPGPEHAPPRPAAVTAGHQRVDPVLRADQGDACANAALERISARAVEVHGMAAHYAADLPAADAADEAMRQAVAAAAPGLAAALQLIAFDEALGLSSEQQMYMWERAAELNLAVVEDLAGLTPCQQRSSRRSPSAATRSVMPAGRRIRRSFTELRSEPNPTSLINDRGEHRAVRVDGGLLQLPAQPEMAPLPQPTEFEGKHHTDQATAERT